MIGQPGAIWCPSPNFGPRRDGLCPALVVIHFTAMQSCEAARDRLCDPSVEVSSHYLIGNDGLLLQLVDEEMRAWHAGAGEWRGQEDINSRSIGIELDNQGDHPFSEPQMQQLEMLLRGILERWSIPVAGVIGHSDMAPGRKFDPGPRFDWGRLECQGLAARVPFSEGGSSPDLGQFVELAQAAGYTAPASEEDVLRAFRDRFRPGAKGTVDPADLLILDALVSQRTLDPSSTSA